MKNVIRIAALALLLVPALVSAQEPQPQHPLAGYWAGLMSEGQDSEVIVEFRIQGDVVTGPIQTSQVGDRYIRNGSVTGNTISFVSPSLDPQGEGASLLWTGQLTGNNELAFSVVPENGDGPAKEFVLAKRVVTPAGGGR